MTTTLRCPDCGESTEHERSAPRGACQGSCVPSSLRSCANCDRAAASRPPVVIQQRVAPIMSNLTVTQQYRKTNVPACTIGGPGPAARCVLSRSYRFCWVEEWLPSPRLLHAPDSGASRFHLAKWMEGNCMITHASCESLWLFNPGP